MKLPLANRKILITGGSVGIGQVIAQHCAAAGATLMLVARHQPDLKKTVTKLSRPLQQNHQHRLLDVSQFSAVKRIMTVIAGQGGLDAIVNCAGVYGPIGRTETVELETIAETLRINLLGTVAVCRYGLPLLKKSRRGKIINLAGGGAANAFPHYSAYALSKVAVVRFTENLAIEYRHNRIDVNAVAPGFVLTRLHQETLAAGEQAGREFLEKTKAAFESGGVSPERVAELIVFLLSSAADGITGKFISAVWDTWPKKSFQDKLRRDPDFCTLRRIDEQTFFKRLRNTK